MKSLEGKKRGGTAGPSSTLGGSYKPSVTSSLSKSKQSINNDTHSLQGHGHSNANSLRRKELHQLETFIKTRSQQLDSEIDQIRDKLKKSGKLGHSHLIPDPNASAALNADIISQRTGKTGMTVSGTGLGRVSLQSQSILQQSKTATASLSQDVNTSRKLATISDKERAKDDNNTMVQLATLLATLKLKCEDAGLTDIELRELLLPSDLMEPGDFKLPLSEISSVLQTDLLMPLSNYDQRLLLEMYGDEKNLIDVRMLLSDAGMWYEIPGRDDRNPLTLTSTADRMAEKLQLSPPKKEKRVSAVDDEYLSKSGIFKQQTKQILKDTNTHVDSLHDLHELIMEEREWDDLTNSATANFQNVRGKGPFDPSKDLDISLTAVKKRTPMEGSFEQTPRSPGQRSTSPRTNAADSTTPATPMNKKSEDATSLDPQKYAASRDKLKDLLASSGMMSKENDLVQALAEENQRLKKEIAAFDGDFFEELEDLKYRYAKLQEVIGEDPLAPSLFGKNQLPTPLNDATVNSDTDGTSKLPLSRLAWSVRNSMRAMDRAADDSPLVQGPRMVNAYTYAPGVPSTIGDRNLTSANHHRSVSAIRSETVATAATASSLPPALSHSSSNSSQRHPYAMSSSTSGRVLDGGIHGIGGGKYTAAPDEAGGNFANLCERRLVFELANQPNPYNATNEFLARVVDVAEKNLAMAKDPAKVGGLFISVKQLMEIMMHSRLSLSAKEVEVLASGFASDGNGSIDAQEFCDMVRMLLYNLTGSHFLQQSTSLSTATGRARRRHPAAAGGDGDDDDDDGHVDDGRDDDNGRSPGPGDRVIHPLLRNAEYRRLVVDLCETMITYDRQALLGTSKNLMQTLLKPFVEEDLQGSGVLSFADFITVVKSMGSMFSYHEYKVLAAPFVLDDPPAASAYPSSNLNHLKSFREAKLTGALRGKASTQGVIGDFLAEHHLGDIVQRPITMADVDARVVDDSIIEYPPFVKMVVDELEALLDAKGGLDLTSASRLPWVLKEMEFVDVLITQLENMRATARRKVLITLQYALQNADTKQVGELDGFALLTTLLNCGFRLQRYHRVQLLQAAEEFGGTLEYSRLILTLLQTAIDWTHHERDIVLKILKAMGVTVTERRQWLAKLKKMLMQSASQTKLKLTARRSARSAAAASASGSGSGSGSASAKGRVRGVEHRVQLNKEAETEEDLLVWSQRLTSDGDEPSSSSSGGAVVMIAPSAFLHVLRDCHVHLSPEEEATLLDCLDTERIARQEASSFAPIHHHSQQKNTARLLFGTGGGGGGGSDGFNVPMVDFQSFLTFCSRHCGSWVDNKPLLQIALHEAIATLHNPLQALHEFITLLTSFDERKQGFISQRAFLICCHRARLLANVPDHVLNELTEVLAVDGAGEIEYRSLILQLRGICSGLTMQQLETAHTSLLHQLLRNASDHRETLAPLRNWLLHHTDIQAMMLTTREFNALLREFSVLYRPDDLDLLLMEIGQEVDFQDVASVMATSKAHVGRATGERRYDSQHRVEHVQRTTWVVDTKKFMALCLRTRPSWMLRNPRLAKHLLLSLKRLYHQRHAASIGGGGGGGGGGGSAAMPAVNLTLTIDGSEMAALDDVMNRIRAFASDDFRSAASSALPPTYENGGLAAFQTAGAHTKEEQRPVTLIEADIFAYIVRHLGIELTKEDIQFLCDASDPYPEARHINPDLLYDILHIEWLQQQSQSSHNDGADALSTRTPNEVTDEDLAMLTDAAVYALDHLQQLVRKTQAHCGRTVEEWTADLRCLFTGFDPHGQGFMTYEDFLLALSLLNVKMSAELIKDIPYVGKNRGYVQYPKIVDYILRANPVGYGKKNGQGTREGLVASGSKTELLHHLSEHDAEEEAKGKRSMTIRQRQDALERSAGGTGSGHGGNGGGGGPGPVLGLLRVVRKKMCGFIVSEANVEEAWLEMLRVFQRFDVTEQKVVSPRDFCLAVSVLLDDDQMVLTKDEWEEVIAYFAVPPAEAASSGDRYGSRSLTGKSSASAAAQKSRVTVNGDVAVDYMLFCEMVLDPSEVQKKLQDVKFSRLASASTAKMDRAKEKLSTSVANKSRTNSVDRQRMQAALSDPSPSSSFRKQAWAAGGSDTIEDRFERASVKYQETMKQGKEYGSGSASASSRALGRVDAGTDSYRVARTQGQASRDSAAVRLRAPKSATVTVPSKDIYLAGKGVGGSRPSSAPRGRLNQTS